MTVQGRNIMAITKHSLDDFIKVIRVMNRKSFTLEETIYWPAGAEGEDGKQQKIDLLVDDIQAHAQQLING